MNQMGKRLPYGQNIRTKFRDERSHFYSKVRRTDDCWLYTGLTSTSGYGRHYSQGVFHQAHRFALQLEGVDIASGMFVCHSCDNPPCVNPDHLWVGTHQENMRDSKDKKRNNHGSKNGRARLTEMQVGQIRRLFAKGGIFQRQIADEFDVHPSTISLIVSRKKWKNAN